jgi:hypothetical protein
MNRCLKKGSLGELCCFFACLGNGFGTPIKINIVNIIHNKDEDIEDSCRVPRRYALVQIVILLPVLYTIIQLHVRTVKYDES